MQVQDIDTKPKFWRFEFLDNNLLDPKTMKNEGFTPQNLGDNPSKKKVLGSHGILIFWISLQIQVYPLRFRMTPTKTCPDRKPNKHLSDRPLVPGCLRQKIPYFKPTWVHVPPRNTKIDRQITSWSSWWFQPQKYSSISIISPRGWK